MRAGLRGFPCLEPRAFGPQPRSPHRLVFFSLQEVSLLVGSAAVRACLQWPSLMSPCCCWRAPPEGGCSAGKWGGVLWGVTREPFSGDSEGGSLKSFCLS